MLGPAVSLHLGAAQQQRLTTVVAAEAVCRTAEVVDLLTGQDPSCTDPTCRYRCSGMAV